MMHTRSWRAIASGAGLRCGAAFAAMAAAVAVRAAGPDFAREVRPILSNRCFKCHGPDTDNQRAGLRLDLREAATAELDSGARAIVPGRPAESELVARITSTDPDLVMPPPGTKTSLTADEKRILAEWIAAGAKYDTHWAFVAPRKPPVPAVKEMPPGWDANPIDAFVLARLENENLRPAPAAEKATLCRRVHLDLVGLPPTPAELDAFLGDSSPDAYEKLVDRLLASPRYGERWARRWLDLARYADTNGYEKDRPREIWPYRDWVIRALNADMPFDHFTIRQIAGDLLPGATPDDIVATGFHRNTMINEEGGIDPLEFRYLAMVDRVGTTGTTWLGLTTACAQCHTHKFDPITQTDFFALFALLNNVDEPEWIIEDEALERRRAAISKQLDKAWNALPAKWPLPTVSGQPGDTDRSAADEFAEEAKRAVLVAERFAAWHRYESDRAVHWRLARPVALRSNLPHLSLRDDSSILASGDITKSDVYEIELPPAAAPVRALRLEVLPDPSLPAHGPGLCWYEGPNGDFFLSEFEVRVGDRRVPIEKATESFAGTTAYGTSAGCAADAIDGDMSSGWSINGEQGRPNAAVFVLGEPIPAGGPLSVTLRFELAFASTLGCFRLSVADDGDAEAHGHTAREEALLLTALDDLSPAEQKTLFRRFLESAPELAEPVKEIRGLEASLRDGRKTLVMRERPAENPRKTFRHHRGEYTQPQEEVRAAAPSFLPPLPAGAPANRMGLASWLVAPENPLTARVAVNRQWQAFFGRGFVASLEDFGHQSEPPSHPELLDWLAVTFAENLGWSLKKLHRLIVTSATYRQASAVSPALLERDPGNILLARGPRQRLEAEVIRDSMLAAAGLLSEKMYGPGVRPPQPEGVTEVAYESPKWPVSTGEDRYRRSVYTFQKRTAPFAMTAAFDGPSGEACVPLRDVSNSPLQALILLNDPMFVEIAQALGRAVMAAGPDDDTRLSDLGRRVLSRELDAGERATLAAYVAEQRRRLAAGELDSGQLAGGDGPDTIERAAWTLAARAVMNLDEAIVKE